MESPHPAETTASEPKPSRRTFESTHWSLVRAAGMTSSASGEALEKLCSAYRPPIFAILRMKGYDAHEAEDLTQEFFARLLKGNAFATVSPEKGRFRTFLLAAMKHFLINPFFLASGPPQWLFQGPPAESKVLAAPLKAKASESHQRNGVPNTIFIRAISGPTLVPALGPQAPVA